ncbi:MAG: HEPN domain-containing protein [Clostridiales bacterium]|nr:HEPN domain-containing protein [Clostridiales bacterium]
MPPKTHDLQRLAVRGSMFDGLTDGQLALFDKLTPLQIEARYPEYKERIKGRRRAISLNDSYPAR